jgi:hypothetical protein
MSPMTRSGGLLLACFSMVVAGCGDDASGVDSGPTGPCSGALSMAWPSDDDPQFCALEWDGSKPAVELTECGEVFENCSETGPIPDFTCVDDPPGPGPSDPATVTLTGFVDVFSSGPSANGARIQLYRASALESAGTIEEATPLAEQDIVLDATTLIEARACPKETDFMQGQCVVPTDDCSGQCDKVLGAGTFCYETTCEDLQRWEVRYAIPNVPTNEFLVVRTVGLDAQGNPQTTGNTWSPLFQYNVYLATNDRACASVDDSDCIDTTATPALYRSEVNLLSSQDYMTIPTSAGLSAGITTGHGAIAGEVHDCDSSRIQHVQIGFEQGRPPRVLAYFNGNPVKTLPRLQQAALGTNLLSLYAGLDLAPGPVSVVAIGVEGGALREVGRFRARIWPDSTTLVRIGGGRPAQP